MRSAERKRSLGKTHTSSREIFEHVHVYCAWFEHKVSIPISLRRVYDASGLTLCLSYKLYETRTVSESAFASALYWPLYEEEALTRVSRNVRRCLLLVAAAHARICAKS